MAKLKLHLDEDASSPDLYHALLERGHNVTLTPNDWMAKGANDQNQLLQASAMNRCIFTFNIRDFVFLAHEYPDHHGIIIANQRQWKLPLLISTLDNALTRTSEELMIGQIRWLNEWLE